MGFRLFTEELRDEIMKKQREDPELQEKLKGLTFRLLLVGTDAPGNEDRQLAINLQAGKFINVGVTKDPAPSYLRNASFDRMKFDAKVIGDHQTLFNLVTGNLDLLSAFDKVQIEGDTSKLSAQLPGFIGFIEYLSTMDIEP
jgi:hypothetical protein